MLMLSSSQLCIMLSKLIKWKKPSNATENMLTVTQGLTCLFGLVVVLVVVLLLFLLLVLLLLSSCMSIMSSCPSCHHVIMLRYVVVVVEGRF